MNALDQRIVECYNQGAKPKAIYTTLKAEGRKKANGRALTAVFIQNKLQYMKAKGFIGVANVNHPFTADDVLKAQQSNPALLQGTIFNILNDPNLSDTKKVSVLKAWFA